MPGCAATTPKSEKVAIPIDDPDSAVYALRAAMTGADLRVEAVDTQADHLGRPLSSADPVGQGSTGRRSHHDAGLVVA